MAAGAMTKTSQVNVDEYIDYFTPFLEAGKDILHVSLSSGLSGTYNAANVARSELLARFPDRKIYIIDSLGASSGYGLFMDKLAAVSYTHLDVYKRQNRTTQLRNAAYSG